MREYSKKNQVQILLGSVLIVLGSIFFFQSKSISPNEMVQQVDPAFFIDKEKNTSFISVNELKEIIINEIGDIDISKDDFIAIEKDYDDGMPIYEVNWL
jgi:low affinity Fe/Cu permease